MDINQLEIDILSEINRIRVDPSSLINELQAMTANFKGKYYKIPKTNINVVTHEGVEAVLKAIEIVRRAKPIKPLKEVRGLYLAARDHANDLGESGKTSHVGSNGSHMNERIERYGDWENSIAENIVFDDMNAKDIVLGMLIDDGNKSKGHRRNLMNPEFASVGVACCRHLKHKWVTVIDFAVNYKDKEEETIPIETMDTYTRKTTLVQEAKFIEDMVDFKVSGNKNDDCKECQVNADLKNIEPNKESKYDKFQIFSSSMKIKEEREIEAIKNETKESQLLKDAGSNADEYKILNCNEAMMKDNRDWKSLLMDNEKNLQTRSLATHTRQDNYDFEEDPDKPTNAINVKIKKQVKIQGNQRMIKVTKIYTMEQGEPEFIEIIDFEDVQ